MKTEIFKKNIKALKGSEYKNLKQKLNKIKDTINYNYVFNKDPLNCNIVYKNSITIYQNPLEELQEKLVLFQKEYSRYPVLFFYGLGNGIFYKSLLANKEHKRIIVYEKDIELMFLVLNMIDFSKELLEGRFILIHTKELNYTKADILCSFLNLFLKTYNLHIHCDFYEKEQKKEIKFINDLNSKAIHTIALRKGNNPVDAMQGVEQFILNLPKMLTHPSFSSFKKKRSNKSKTAILVATGPSLKKQLPTLKKYVNKATIFCADSAYPILAKAGIKPDYVCMLERDDVVAKCFDNDFGEFDKDITFILVSLVYKDSINFLERNKRKYLLVSRSLPFAHSLGLHDFGYVGGGMSVAHLNYELALLLGHENIILIGQDLAYSNDGESHTEGFLHRNYHEGHFQRDKDKFTTLAYGGKGYVHSSKIWILFKQIFENLIYEQTKVKIYNATEGGARIEGTIEKPFKELCKTLLKEELKKPFPKLHKPKRKDSNEFMLQAYNKIKQHIKASEKFFKECKRLHKALNNQSKIRYTPQELNAQIDTLKATLESQKYIFLREVISPSLFHLESSFSKIYVSPIHNESDKQNKLTAWILAHKTWLEDIAELTLIQEKALKIAIMPLQDILEKRKLI
ncbi:motility associated factor glycosyltransferase family protein [Campylobacter lari]|uniref:motility associated factor glycosyltransferase family protein n=1 Tax=Campylobacter lari TaxID=201 RepID=UPI0012D034C1|nr:motility associated factor glycosyltransferase family protein [Campylobacter lari]EAK0442215.1 motility associated factor glycosyltransferase family protein [Campylobacter lari]MCH3697855.1 motility associated factor glycosyltransferase family protein [Campylobacter lari]MCV3333714.1 motility associated factor glycosyltransferase family protein [Campylobacter lari]MCV3350689.1 motility associated factor glycosyltransferase family protein [Campylobacter lari]MCW0188705.1 motility associated 